MTSCVKLFLKFKNNSRLKGLFPLATLHEKSFTSNHNILKIARKKNKEKRGLRVPSVLKARVFIN